MFVSRLLSSSRATISLSWFLVAGGLTAGPIEELHKLSDLPPVDLAKLKQGEIIMTRAGNGSSPRGITLQSCYFIHAPMADVAHKLLHWDPRPHSELEVMLYHEYKLPGDAADFQSLQLNQNNSQDRWLLDRVTDVAHGSEPAADLHLTTEEVAGARKDFRSPNESWREILMDRSHALATGGIAAVPPYGKDKAISPGSEFRDLLSSAPKVGQHFKPLTASRPIVSASNESAESVAYWESTKVRSHTTLQLGIMLGKKTGPDSWQVMDCVYYPSDTYFMALDLFQLWELEGGTLIWQAGFVSAPFRSYLGGIDRYVAGKQMADETRETIEAFRKEAQRHR